MKMFMMDPFHANDLFLYLLKSQKTSGFDVFRGYRKRPMARNGLTENMNFDITPRQL